MQLFWCSSSGKWYSYFLGVIDVKKSSFLHVTGQAVSELALELLAVQEGDRIPPIISYEKRLEVSRGTIQNAFASLIDAGAIQVLRRGRAGSFLEKKDSKRLQKFCMQEEMVGIMPLPYSIAYKALATAFYESFASLSFNMVYARGSIGRISFVERGIASFAVVSKFSALESIRLGKNITCLMDFGPGSYLDRHGIVFANQEADAVVNGMRVAIDPESLDQESLTRKLTQGLDVELVITKSQNIVTDLLDGKIDAGIWNVDDILENHKNQPITVCPLPEEVYQTEYRSAAVVVKKDHPAMQNLLLSMIDKSSFQRTLRAVRKGEKESKY